MKFPQDATRWFVIGNNEYNEKAFSDATALKVRWEEKIQKMITPKGEEITSMAVVYSLIDITIGDFLFLGSSIAADPRTLNSHQVLLTEKIPNLRGTKFVRKVFL